MLSFARSGFIALSCARQLSTVSKLQPVEVGTPTAWYGKDLKKQPERWVYTFNSAQLEEIEAAAKKLVARNVNLADVTRKDIHLPTLGPILERIQNEVINGLGFCLLKGLPVKKWNISETAAVYWVIGTFFGAPTPQNAKGHLLGHVKDLGHDISNPVTRIYATNARQPFHVDLCDIVGLLCLKTAKVGGESIIASSITVYNELVKSRPELAQLLAEPLYHDRKNEIPAGKKPYYAMPMFNFYQEKLSVFLSPDFIRTAQRFPELPRHSNELKEALQLMQDLPAREDIRLDMVLEPGDIQFIHNHTIIHSRTNYQDHEDPALKRHLLRLWCSPENARPLPEIFAEQYGNVIPGKRGGIRVPGVAPNVKCEAE